MTNKVAVLLLAGLAVQILGVHSKTCRNDAQCEGKTVKKTCLNKICGCADGYFYPDSTGCSTDLPKPSITAVPRKLQPNRHVKLTCITKAQNVDFVWLRNGRYHNTSEEENYTVNKAGVYQCNIQGMGATRINSLPSNEYKLEFAQTPDAENSGQTAKKSQPKDAENSGQTAKRTQPKDAENSGLQTAEESQPKDAESSGQTDKETQSKNAEPSGQTAKKTQPKDAENSDQTDKESQPKDVENSGLQKTEKYQPTDAEKSDQAAEEKTNDTKKPPGESNHTKKTPDETDHTKKPPDETNHTKKTPDESNDNKKPPDEKNDNNKTPGPKCKDSIDCDGKQDSLTGVCDNTAGRCVCAEDYQAKGDKCVKNGVNSNISSLAWTLLLQLAGALLLEQL